MKRQDLLDQFWANEIPIAPVRHAHEALEDEQVINNGMSVVVDDPVHGRVASGRHLLPRSTPRRRRRCRGRNPRSGSTPTRCSASVASEPARGARCGPRSDRCPHALEGIKILDLGNFLAGPFGPMLLGDLGATVYKLESPQGDQMRPVTQPFNGCQRGKLDVVVDLKQPEGLEIAHRLMREVDVVHHNMRPGVAERLGRRLRDRQAAQPDRDLLPHDDVGQRRPRATWPGLRPARAVVVRARAGARRRGQRPELVPLRHVRPGVRGAVGARGADGAVLARAHRRGPAGRHVDRERRRAPQHRRVDRARRLVGAARAPTREQTGFGPALPAATAASDGGSRSRVSGDALATWRRRCPRSTAMPLRRPGALERDVSTLAAFFVARTRAGGVRPARRRGRAGGDRDPDARPHVVRPARPRRRRSRRRLRAPAYGRFRQFGHLVQPVGHPGHIAGPPPLLGEHSREVLAELGYSDRRDPGPARRSGVTLWPD